MMRGNTVPKERTFFANIHWIGGEHVYWKTDVGCFPFLDNFLHLCEKAKLCGVYIEKSKVGPQKWWLHFQKPCRTSGEERILKFQIAPKMVVCICSFSNWPFSGSMSVSGVSQRVLIVEFPWGSCEPFIHVASGDGNENGDAQGAKPTKSGCFGNLDGGNSDIFYFQPDLWGNDPIWRAYFSNGLVQPPTRNVFGFHQKPLKSRCEFLSALKIRF